MGKTQNMQSKRFYYRVDRRRISFIRFIIEAYEGIAVVSTLDAVSGNIVLTVAPGCEDIVRDIMNGMSADFMMQPCPAPE